MKQDHAHGAGGGARVPVATDEEAIESAAEVPARDHPGKREFALTVSTELGEADPVKAKSKIQQLRAENDQFKAAAKASASRRREGDRRVDRQGVREADR
jgi:hypothetical protein